MKDHKKIIEDLKDFHAHMFNQSNPNKNWEKKSDAEMAYLDCAEGLELIIKGMEDKYENL